jgi:hypothetical protein
MPRLLTAPVDNVEKIIWDDVPDTTITIVTQAYAYTKLDLEQAFALAWDIRALQRGPRRTLWLVEVSENAMRMTKSYFPQKLM